MRLLRLGLLMVLAGALADCGSAAQTPVQKYPAQVTADKPVAYWRLGESAGTTSAADASGNQLTGTYDQGATLGRVGVVVGDSAVAFASLAGVTVRPSSALDLRTQVSVEAWIAPSVAGENGGIVEKTVGGRANTQYLLFLEGGAIKFRGHMPDGNNITAVGPQVSVGGWSHVVGTADGSTLRLYLNAEPVASAGGGTLASGSGPTFIGRLGAEGGTPGIYPFTGAIDEVAIYSVALSADRVRAHYQAADVATPSPR